MSKLTKQRKRTRVEAMGLRDLGRLTLVYFDEIERDDRWQKCGERHLRFYGDLDKVSLKLKGLE